MVALRGILHTMRCTKTPPLSLLQLPAAPTEAQGRRAPQQRLSTKILHTSAIYAAEERLWKTMAERPPTTTPRQQGIRYPCCGTCCGAQGARARVCSITRRGCTPTPWLVVEDFCCRANIFEAALTQTCQTPSAADAQPFRCSRSSLPADARPLPFPTTHTNAISKTMAAAHLQDNASNIHNIVKINRPPTYLAISTTQPKDDKWQRQISHKPPCCNA